MTTRIHPSVSYSFTMRLRIENKHGVPNEIESKILDNPALYAKAEGRKEKS